MVVAVNRGRNGNIDSSGNNGIKGLVVEMVLVVVVLDVVVVIIGILVGIIKL